MINSNSNSSIFSANIFKKPIARSAGVIPYTYIDGVLHFLLQKEDVPHMKKAKGWNDFGGKPEKTDKNSMETAVREFNEETGCLFYLKETDNILYNQLKQDNYDAKNKDHNKMVADTIVSIMKDAKTYYYNKLSATQPLFINNKTTYVSYFLPVEYIPTDELPKAEDMHVDYETRYWRTCRWFNYQEIINMDDRIMHSRIRVSPIKNKLMYYFKNRMLICSTSEITGNIFKCMPVKNAVMTI
jgi:8-oxo-dGTP pyrophosphatase MutT (NUDIX family)